MAKSITLEEQLEEALQQAERWDRWIAFARINEVPLQEYLRRQRCAWAIVATLTQLKETQALQSQTPDNTAALEFLATYEPPGTPVDEADFPRFGAPLPPACGLQLDGTCTKDDATCAQTCPLHHLVAWW